MELAVKLEVLEVHLSVGSLSYEPSKLFMIALIGSLTRQRQQRRQQRRQRRRRRRRQQPTNDFQTRNFFRQKRIEKLVRQPKKATIQFFLGWRLKQTGCRFLSQDCT